MKHQVILAGEVHVQSYANLVLLQKVYSNLEQRQWVKRRKEFLKEELAKHGKLVCHYCGKDDLKLKSTKRAEQATVDHIVPISAGGEPLDKKNFAVCCGTCNRRKASTPADDFKKSKYIKKKRNGHG
jgi:5-methylcytosine-specific restriction endonuclease McrA